MISKIRLIQLHKTCYTDLMKDNQKNTFQSATNINTNICSNSELLFKGTLKQNKSYRIHSEENWKANQCTQIRNSKENAYIPSR